VEVSYAEFSPNGIWLATCCADQYLNRWYAQVWNATTGLAHGPQLLHGDGVCHVSFSSDSRRLVTAGEDFTAIVWDVMTGEQVTPVLHHAHQVRTAGFSPDAKWIVTASLDNTARIWSAETGDASTPPLWHANQLDRAQFLSGPRRIIPTDGRNDTRIWDFPINTMPLDDLRKLAALLSGNTMNPQGSGTVSPQSQSLDSLWLELHQKYPVLFTTSAAETDAWHSFQAEQCETAGQWTAAIFHLNRLLLLHPGDPSLPARIAKANEHLPLGK
jgi:WD40 repeat protein